MSAKWRRNKKDLKRINLLRKFTKLKNHKKLNCVRVTKENFQHIHRNKQTIRNLRINGKLKPPEPLIDILEQENHITVIAEFAGFNSNDLKITARNQRLTLSAASQGRKYHKSLNLPKRVIPKAIRTTFKNGVLEIQLKKASNNKKIETNQSSWIEHAN